MFQETPPKDLRKIPVTVHGAGEARTQGLAATHAWTSQERLKRGFKRSARFLAPIMLAILPLAVLEPFLFMIWGSVFYGFMFLVAGPMLFAKFYVEQESFFFVEASCPGCKSEGPLKPFLSTQWGPTVKVLCTACGESFDAVAS